MGQLRVRCGSHVQLPTADNPTLLDQDSLAVNLGLGENSGYSKSYLNACIPIDVNFEEPACL